MKNTRPALLPSICIVLISLTAGCSASTPAPTEATTELGKVGTIEEVVDAYIQAGGVCNWDQSDKVDGAVASGDCSDSTVISIYTNAENRDQVVDNVRSLYELLTPDAEDPMTLLVGENWIINSPDAEGMQGSLGGEWVSQ